MGHPSKKWALAILFETGRREGWTRFRTEVQDWPDHSEGAVREVEGPGEQGLVGHRVGASEFPVRSEYGLTGFGRRLMPIVREIRMWAPKWGTDNVPCMDLDYMKCRLRGNANPTD